MSTATRTYASYVGGEWLTDVGADKLSVTNPATGETIGEIPVASAATVDRAVKAAQRAFPGYAETTPGERAGMLLRLADALESHTDELASLESLNVGKPLGGARDEVAASADCLRFFAGAARVLEGKAAAEYVAGRTSIIRRDPIGVCGGITPWNYPLMMAVWKIGPALATGNTIVLKPSELTPLTTLRLAELAEDIFPVGVLNVVTGDGAVTGDAIVRHPQVRFVSLTGDVHTGRAIVRNGADNLKRMHLELGGKAPVIVFDDADLAKLSSTLKVASFWNAGQDCTAACRVLVSDRVHDDFLAEFLFQVESLAVGARDENADADMGPVISQGQRERVLGLVERAEDAGAAVLAGGKSIDSPGFFVAPTVVAGVDQTAEIVQREVFGPVVTVQRFDDEEQAVDWANGVEYGLSASVWSRDPGRLMRVARRLQFGTVWLNDHFTITSEMPHGGYKQSGYGKDMSAYALEDYTVVKHVMLNVED